MARAWIEPADLPRAPDVLRSRDGVLVAYREVSTDGSSTWVRKPSDSA